MKSTVIVSDQSVASADPYDIVLSNIDVVNALLEEYLVEDEIASDALRSYCVDHYLTQVNNGGFSQFVTNTGFSPRIIGMVREGLAAMGAQRHLTLFEENVALVKRLRKRRLRAFLESDYFGDNAERDALDVHTDRFFALAETEDLVSLNAAWLRSLPDLQIMTESEIADEVTRRGGALPDRAERARAALENEPPFVRTIRALADKAGHELDRVTAGDPVRQHDGQVAVAWHFLTDRGHYYMIEADGRATMFDETDKVVTEIETL